MKFKRPSLKVSLGVLVLLLLLNALRQADAFRFLPPDQGLQNCSTFGDLVGAEDLEYVAELDRVFVSADDRQHLFPEGERSGLYFFSLKDPEKTLQKAEFSLPFPFRPHGLTSRVGKDGNITLFAVNHRTKVDSSIEVFQWSRPLSKLVWKETLLSPLLTTPNDLATLDENTLLVTEDHGSPTFIGQSIEEGAHLARGSISQFDGKTWTTVYEGLRFANGIVVPSNGKPGTFFVAEMNGRRILAFEKSPTEAKAKLIQEVAIPSGPDNLTLTQENGKPLLLAATHARMLWLGLHALKASRPSPWQIYSMELDGTTLGTPVLRSSDSTSHFGAGVSTVLPIGDRVYYGQIFRQGIVSCPR